MSELIDKVLFLKSYTFNHERIIKHAFSGQGGHAECIV